MKTAFVFPGQGAQYVGMGKDLLDTSATARAVFEEADEVLGFHLTKLVLEGPEDTLKLTYYTQPALLAMSVAVLRVLDERVKIAPVVAAGHSLGEYSALVAANALSFGDAISLVHRRGQLMDEAFPSGEGAMAAILGLDEEPLARVCASAASEVGEVVEIANLNCPGQIVISGTSRAVSRACELAKESGAKRAIPLAVSGPFHCSLMRPAADAFAQLLDSTTMREAAFPVVANVDGQPYRAAQDLREALKKQLFSPVRWADDVATIRDMGVELIAELGPGTVLSGLIRKIDRGLETVHIEDSETLQSVCERLSN